MKFWNSVQSSRLRSIKLSRPPNTKIAGPTTFYISYLTQQKNWPENDLRKTRGKEEENDPNDTTLKLLT